MNKIILKGRLTADPQTKRVGEKDVLVADFTIAVNRRFKRDVADFINCQAWGSTAEFVKTYFAKGKEILVVGELNIDQYEKDGENHWFTRVKVDEVEFCGGKNDNAETTEPSDDIDDIVEDDIVEDDFIETDDDLPFE